MRLNEVEFQHTNPIGDILEKYRGKNAFVHFSKDEKLGVNPHQHHGDPYGVYFYGIDWLVEQERYHTGNQYAVKFPYYTIIKLRDSSAGITFSTLTKERCSHIAIMNGWKDIWDSSAQEPQLAKRFWKVVKMCDNPLRGIPFVHDDGFGIIHHWEKDQLVIRDPKAMIVLEKGKIGQQVNPKTYSDQSGFITNWKHYTVGLFKMVRARYGGTIAWMNNLPTLSIMTNGATITMSWKESGWKKGIVIDAHWGRATKSVFVPLDNGSSDKSHEEIVDITVKTIDDVLVKAKAKKDLFFTPLISEDESKKIIRSITKNPDTKFVTRISNDEKDFEVRGRFEKQLSEKVTLVSEVYVRSTILERKNDKTFGISVWINDVNFVSGYGDTVEELLAKLPDNASHQLDSIAPNARYSTHFHYENEYDAALRMLSRELQIPALTKIFDDRITSSEKEIAKVTPDSIYYDLGRIYPTRKNR